MTIGASLRIGVHTLIPPGLHASYWNANVSGHPFPDTVQTDVAHETGTNPLTQPGFS